jgi:hypothetical protein
MKETTVTSTVESSEAFKEFSFGIKDSGLPYVLAILRGKLYQNKIASFIREICSNSWDANVEAGHGNKPIEVTLPSPLDPNFRTRDFGPGLSMEDVKEIYVNYGESTKRNTNKERGQFGLGSKSPFAYSDSFLVVSYYSGQKTVYNCYIDPTQIGKCAVMTQEKSDEPEGVEVVVPIKSGDESKVQGEAINLFRYSKVKPIIKGISAPDLNRPEPTYKGKGWRIYSGNKPMALMGWVAFPIPADGIPLEDHEQAFLNHGLELEFNIGELQLVPSREQIELTEKSVVAIQKKIRAANEEMKLLAEASIAGATSLFEATWAYGKLPSEIRKSVKLSWQGKSLDHDYFSWNQNEGVIVTQYSYNYRNKLRTSSDLAMRANQTYWIADCKRIKDRVKELLKEAANGNKPETVNVLQGSCPSSIVKWAQANQIDLALFKRLSTIVPPSVERASGPRAHLKIWHGDQDTYRRKPLSYWTRPMEAGEHVDCYVVPHGNRIGNRRYREFNHYLGVFREHIGNFVVAVVTEAKRNLMTVPHADAFIKERVAALVISKGIVEHERIELPYCLQNLNSDDSRHALGDHDVMRLAQSDSKNNSALVNLAKNLGIKVPFSSNGSKTLLASILKRYPLVPHISSSTEPKYVIAYIQAMDVKAREDELMARVESAEKEADEKELVEA